ncbi:DUF2066 domain-containing protein [Marinobacter sp.]|uniref:DUF2066 domain-containing protein n=1 Tax=Marinobacter sp. TaxID=50741 RepID=UPI0034A09F76
MSITAQLKQKTGLMLIVLAGFCMPAAAVTVDGLYSIQVPVAGSAPEDLKRGYADGLRLVLLRVSGDRDIMSREGMASLMDEAQTLVQSYQFLRASGTGAQDRLSMTFGAVGVNRALASLDAPVWGANRPLTLAWVAVEDRGDRQLLSKDGASSNRAWNQAFSAAAARRGLPLALPSADRGADRRLLSEVWGQFMGPVREASESVEHDLLTVVKISRRGDQWQGAWRLEGSGFETGDEMVSGSSPEQLTNAIVGAWADMLADRYAVAAGDVENATRVDIVVDGVRSMDDYASVQRTFAQMTPVVGANPVRVTKDRMTVRVSFSGELSQLERYIELDGRFFEGQSRPGNGSPSETETVPKPGAESSSDEPVVVDTPEAPGAPNADEGDQGLQFSPLETARDESDESTAAKAFESLYQTLRYRWQGGDVVAVPDQSTDG